MIMIVQIIHDNDEQKVDENEDEVNITGVIFKVENLHVEKFPLLLLKFRCVFLIGNIIPSEELHLVLNF